MPRPPPSAELQAARHALQALAHPTRQRILALLLRESDGLSYKEVARALGFKEASSIDRHLKLLVGAGLADNLLGRVDGRIRSLFVITATGKEWLERCGLNSPEVTRVLIEGADRQF